MKILFASLLKRKVTPATTASRPRIIYELAKRLIKNGHEVSILGTKDSRLPGANIIPVINKGYAEMAFENPVYGENSYLIQMVKKIEEIGDKFDIIHNHTYPEFFNLMAIDNLKTPMITTVHAQATLELDNVLSLFKNTYLISLSKAHRKLFKKTKFHKIIYNGIDTDLYKMNKNKKGYLLWVGRLSKAKNIDGSFMDPKGVKWAIELARKTGQELLLSGNVEDMDFFNKDVKPYLNNKIKWFGPVSSEQLLTKKQVAKLMGEARAYLMTINWNEPFGLVMAEAMSCGTPVIAFSRGAVPEIVVNNKTGFVVPYSQGTVGLASAVEMIDKINPEDCREHIINNFSVEKMAKGYEDTYKEIIKDFSIKKRSNFERK